MGFTVQWEKWTHYQAVTAQCGQSQAGGSIGRGIWAGMQKPRRLPEAKESACVSQGVREGFLKEVVHKRIGMSNMKRRKSYARQEAQL